MNAPKFNLEDRLLEFSVRIIRVTESMKRSRAANHIADQLLRSGTSPYGNHGEAEGAESRGDFIHKLKVCYKELRESRRWLRRSKKPHSSPNPNCSKASSVSPTNWCAFSLRASAPPNATEAPSLER